jgi:pilus assembly protein Flp/PilA
MGNFISSVKVFANDESGVTAIEYGLIAALVGVGIAVAATSMKDGITGLWNDIGTALTNALAGWT